MKKYIDFFDRYTNNYINIAKNDFQKIHISRKIEHSKRVNKNAVEIAEDLGLDIHELYLINIASLLHDIARFKQFYEYNTYIDKISFDHGEEGARILEEENVLEDLTESDKKIILEIVKLHNYIILPDSLPKKLRLFVSIIRDADKLDWMYAMVNIIPKLSRENQEIFYSNKLENDEISLKLVESVLENKKIVKADLETIGELKIWTIIAIVTEYECSSSLKIIRRNDLINQVYNMIKFSEEKEIIYNYVINKIENEIHFTY